MGRIRTALAGKKLLTEVAAEAAVTATAHLTESLGIDSDEHLWQGVGTSKRDLPSYTHDQAIEVVFGLYQFNSLGHRITELNRDFIVGDGISYTARNPDVEQITSDFWNDPVNDLDLRLPEFALEIGLFGELAPEVGVGETAGVVQLGYIDPSQIKAVEPWSKNLLVPDQIRVRRKGSGLKGKAIPVVRPRDDGLLSGDAFYFRVNAVSNATRGWPDLLHLADWLDIYDQMLWEMMERAKLIRSFVYDVTMEGSEAQIQEYARRNSAPPKSGTVHVHSKSMKWDVVAPTLQSDEMVKEADKILEHIAAGAGLPKTWLSSTEDVNKATAQVMDVPTIRRLSQRQRYFTHAVHRMVAFAIDKAIEAKRLKVDADGKVPIFDEDGNQTTETAKPAELVTINAPELSPRDLASAATTIRTLADTLAVAQSQGWIGEKVPPEVLALLLQQVGYDLDPNAEPDEARPADGDPEKADVPDDVAESLRIVTG